MNVRSRSANACKIAAFGAASAAGFAIPYSISEANAVTCVTTLTDDGYLNIFPEERISTIWLDEDTGAGGGLGGENNAAGDRYPLPVNSQYGFVNVNVGGKSPGVEVVFEKGTSTTCQLYGKVGYLDLEATTWAFASEVAAPTSTVTGTILKLEIWNFQVLGESADWDASWGISLYGRNSGGTACSQGSQNERQLTIHAWLNQFHEEQFANALDDEIACIIATPDQT